MLFSTGRPLGSFASVVLPPVITTVFPGTTPPARPTPFPVTPLVRLAGRVRPLTAGPLISDPRPLKLPPAWRPAPDSPGCEEPVMERPPRLSSPGGPRAAPAAGRPRASDAASKPQLHSLPPRDLRSHKKGETRSTRARACRTDGVDIVAGFDMEREGGPKRTSGGSRAARPRRSAPEGAARTRSCVVRDTRHGRPRGGARSCGPSETRGQRSWRGRKTSFCRSALFGQRSLKLLPRSFRKERFCGREDLVLFLFTARLRSDTHDEHYIKYDYW